MLSIKDLKGAGLKKATGLKKIVKRFHNVNSFGFTIVNSTGDWFDLSGYFYSQSGEICKLRIGRFSDPGTPILSPTYERVVKILSGLEK